MTGYPFNFTKKQFDYLVERLAHFTKYKLPILIIYLELKIDFFDLGRWYRFDQHGRLHPGRRRA